MRGFRKNEGRITGTVHESTKPAPPKDGRPAVYASIYDKGANEWKRRRKQMLADLMKTMSRRDAEIFMKAELKKAIEMIHNWHKESRR